MALANSDNVLSPLRYLNNKTACTSGPGVIKLKGSATALAVAISERL
jgi:hypothetical protein